MNFSESPAYAKDLKRLAKKYQSLPQDIDEFKRVVAIKPLGNSKHFNVITRNEHYTIVKARLFCRYLKGSSLRVIYAFHCIANKIEFIELYSKNEQENESHERIANYKL